MEYLAIDTESCTGKTDDGSLCSLGYAVCDDDFNIVTREDILFNPLPSRFYVGDKKNLKRTGIAFAYSKADFRKSKRFSEEYERITRIFQGKTVLGFSMVNDIKYLNDACRKFGLPIIEYKFLDIQYLYKLIFPAATSIGLKTLCEKYSNEYLAHRSDEDAVASVMLMKSFLQRENVTLSEIIQKYGVYYGENTKDGYYLNYSEAVIKEQYGLKLGKKATNAVFADFLRKLQQKKGKKRIAFSRKLERENSSYLRTIIELIGENDMTFTKDFDAADIFVKTVIEEELPQNLKPKVSVITVSELENRIGYTENRKYFDESFLRTYFTEKTI